MSSSVSRPRLLIMRSTPLTAERLCSTIQIVVGHQNSSKPFKRLTKHSKNESAQIVVARGFLLSATESSSLSHRVQNVGETS